MTATFARLRTQGRTGPLAGTNDKALDKGTSQDASLIPPGLEEKMAPTLLLKRRSGERLTCHAVRARFKLKPRPPSLGSIPRMLPEIPAPCDPEETSNERNRTKKTVSHKGPRREARYRSGEPAREKTQ